MFYLDSDFTLVALAVTPFLLFFVARFKKAMKKAHREVREDQSNMFIVLQKGLESIRSVNAFGRQDYEEEPVEKSEHGNGKCCLKSKTCKIGTFSRGSHHRFCVHRICFVARCRLGNEWRNDHWRAYRISLVHE